MYNSTKFEVWIKLPYSLALQLQTLITQKVFDLELRNFRSNIKLPYGLAPQLQTLITPKVFNLEIRNFLLYILLYLRACMQNFKAVAQKLYVWAMSK